MELTTVISMLERATSVLAKEMGGASMLQLQSATSVVDALRVMVQASALSSADGSALTALVQTEQESSDSEAGSPAAAVYESKSGGIVATLEGLTEKASGQLDKARKGLAESQEKKAGATGDLAVTSADLAEDIATKGTLHQDCMTAAEEFELATKSRGEELGALATAKKVIV